MSSVGIIGFGSFGKFLAETLAQYVDAKTYDPKGAGKWLYSFEEVAQSDFVILAVPLGAYDDVLKKLKPLLDPGVVIVDVASVKMKPLAKIREILPEQPLVATHPMFGPESARDSLEGHTLVMCPDASSKAAYEKIKNFAVVRGLKIQEMTPEAHDQAIATVQGLTFFVARALENMGLHDESLWTPSFGRLLHLAELEKHHSQELFETIQLGNEFTAEVRRRFLDTAVQIDGSLHNQDKSE